MLKKAASVFVQTLKNHGVDRFFCVPGESYLSVMDYYIHLELMLLLVGMREVLALWLLQMQSVQVKLV